MSTVWVTTEPLGRGRYTTVITLTDDIAVSSLRPDQATTWVGSVLEAVARAEHDAAVMTLVVSTLKVGVESAYQLVSSLRADRPLPVITEGLAMAPGVATVPPPVVGAWPTFRPYLTVIHNGRALGQWDPAVARRHAQWVAEAPYIADLDAAFRRELVGTLGLEDDVAKAVVHGLQKHRTT